MFILRRYKSEKVAGFLWNRWPTSNGISGRNEMEWVAGFAWNHWPTWSGIRKMGIYFIKDPDGYWLEVLPEKK